MAQSTFSGPIKAGSVKGGTARNIGSAVLSQTVYFVPTASITTAIDPSTGDTLSLYNGYPAIAWAATAVAVDGVINLPANAAIHDIVVNQPTVTTGGTAINMAVGITAGGVEYMASTNVKATVRLIPTYTATHLTNMANVGTNTAVHVNVTPTVSAVTAGVLSATILYTQV